MIPSEKFVSRKSLSNDIISTGLDDRLYDSNNVAALNPKISLTLSSGIKLMNGPCLEISTLG